ncbi:hypothetical protein O7627_16665 [Solwaraspora sp. WMMD1047]|uniref:hypothetical protein n=1 Tax=Solwaraspora sp. WMMD1047 TaxID=3016102 RepID=UPI0024161C85|nr:hypothetical protein [Solwaraspora sp. WMMD1047]MDG4830928.1 hypothetical protein [Solwaraspora sp. WMMD1047]
MSSTAPRVRPLAADAPRAPANGAAGQPSRRVPTGGPDSPLVPTDGPAARLVPVERGGRPVGAYLVTGTTARFTPVVDLDQVLSAALAAVTVTAAAVSLVAIRRRRPPVIGTVTMGPGGWVSLKGLPGPDLRASRSGGTGRRPLWARILRAQRLVVEPPARARR